MFTNVAALHAEILNKEPRSFVSHHIFEQTPFVFGERRSLWIEWKRTLSELIEVDPQDIVMTGSAAVGFSLNPDKNFKPFDDDSDFDCGVISNHHFEIAWRYLRQMRTSWLSLPRKSRNAIDAHRKTYVFSGTIAANSMLALLPFGHNWQAALDLMSSIEPSRNRDVRLRIYKDYEALRYYQSSNLERLKIIINSEASDEVETVSSNGEIEVEDDL